MGTNRLIQILITIIVLLLIMSLASGLEVGGAFLDREVLPGEHLSHIMLVSIGDSDAPTDIQIDVLGFGQSPDGTSTELQPDLDTSPYSARPFLNVSPDKVHLMPGEQKEITLEADIPVESSGGRYALVLIHTSPQGNGTIGVATAVTVPVVLTIKGSKIIHTGEIQNLTHLKPVSAKEQTISFIFTNTGNHHYKIKSEAVITDKDGNKVANATKSDPSISLLPNLSRLIEFSIVPKDTIEPGNYNANVTVKTTDGTFLAAKEIPFKLS